MGAIRIIALFVFFFISAACGANEKILRSGNDTSTPLPANTEPEKVPFAKDLDDMRTAGFTFVYALRRKDGGKLDADDRGAVKLLTSDTNRRVMADDGHAVIVGSNFQIPPNNMKALYERFAVEAYSPPTAGANTNANK